MAKQYKNKKNFLIIQMNRKEVLEVWGKYGGIGVCDRCNKISDRGYFVACLNDYLCESCFKEWLKDAINYKEDRSYEKKWYNQTVSDLKKIGSWEQ